MKRLTALPLSLLAASLCLCATAQSGKPKPGAKPAPKPAAAPSAISPATSGLKPFTQTIDGTVVKMDMMPVPGGAISLPAVAGQVPAAKVTLKPFWISKLEITWDRFDPWAFPNTGAGNPSGVAAGVQAISRPSRPYVPADLGWGHNNMPVINITYLTAETYCKWLCEKTGKKYRLATEAEWEWACRAGAAAPVKLAGPALDKVAWFDGNSKGQSHLVGGKAPNAWGIQDMIGNVAEWTVGRDGKPVLCGGAWDTKAADLGSGTRAYYTPDWQATDPQMPKSKWWMSDGPFAGFRVVCEP